MIKPLLVQGECILCPMCQEAIAFALVDVRAGMVINSKIFQSIAPQPKLEGNTRQLSHCCKEPIVSFETGKAKVFTKQGWV
jgi:hypothetical protein